MKSSRDLQAWCHVRYNVHIMPRTVTATQARKDFFKLLKQAKAPGHFLSITMDGLPAVTMMSTDEFEGWQETLEIMADPVLRKDLDQAMQEMKNGTLKTVPWEEVKKELGFH